MKSKQFLIRIRIISIGIVLISLLFISKLFFVQVVHGEYFSERADRQYATPAGNIFERGTIYFTERDGTKVSAATLRAGYKIAITPSEVGDPEAVYEALSAYVPINHSSFISSAAKESDPYEEVANRIDKETADKINALNIPGVYIHKEKWRFYPGSDLASHLLGFIGYQGNELGGRYGLERQYNDVLSRTADNPYVNFFAEVFTNLKSTLFEGDDRDGSLVTTIEPTVQSVLEEHLQYIQEEFSAESSGGIIINPKTGAVYAMAAAPSFNVNEFSSVSDASVFRNPLVESVFELGSVIKPLVMSAALEQGVVTPETQYTDLGSVIVEGKKIENFDRKARGTVDMQTVLNQSLNTGMVFVADKLGKKDFRSYMYGYGFKERSGIDLPNETKNLVGNLDSNRDIEFANMSFGQGIAVTPIAAVRAFSALANGGLLVTPYVVEEIAYKQGGKKRIAPDPEHFPRALDEETSETITRMLVGVADDGLKDIVKIENYSIATKTGTAQVARTDGRGYDENKRLHSFFGYFPAYDPQFLIFLYAVDPRGIRYASQSLAPRFKDTVQFLTTYYNIPPDR